MGIDYNFWFEIGYTFSRSELQSLVDTHKVIHEEKFHHEARYDPKTGKKVAPAKVLDVACTEFWLCGDLRCDSEDQLLLSYFADLGFRYGNLGELCGTDDKDFVDRSFASVQARFTGRDGVDVGQLTTGSSILCSTLASKSTKASLNKLRKLLKKLGVDCGEAKVFPVGSVSW